MPLFCDVALPVPLDQTFTYAVNGVVPVVGARVLVPFSGQKLMGVVVKVHEDAPAEDFEIKPVQQVLDDTAVLPDELMESGQVDRAILCSAPRRGPPRHVAARGRGQEAFLLPHRRTWPQGPLRGSDKRIVATVEADARGAEPRICRTQLSRGRRAGDDFRAAVGHKRK